MSSSLLSQIAFSLLIETHIVQTKNTLSKSGNICCYALVVDKPLKLQWLLYIPPTITLDTEFCSCNVLVFSYDSHSQRSLCPYSALIGHYKVDTVYFLQGRNHIFICNFDDLSPNG